MIKITELFIYHFDVQLDLTNFYNLDASYIVLVLNHQALVSFGSSSRTLDHPYALDTIGLWDHQHFSGRERKKLNANMNLIKCGLVHFFLCLNE